MRHPHSWAGARSTTEVALNGISRDPESPRSFALFYLSGKEKEHA